MVISVNKLIKSISTLSFTVELGIEGDFKYQRYVVRYKKSSMEGFASSSFKDLKLANSVFDMQLASLEGH